MADPLLELLSSKETQESSENTNTVNQPFLDKYLSRLLSLKPSDLTTTEPQALAQLTQSNSVALQGLSTRSHRSTIASSDELSTLQRQIPILTSTTQKLVSTIPDLDASAVSFASTYSKSRFQASTGAGAGATTSNNDDGSSSNAITQRKESMVLSRQASKLQDILELPALLSTAIASASAATTGTGSAGAGSSNAANYTQALDLYAHIKRLQIMYPSSRLVASVQDKAEDAMREMTGNLLSALRGQNVRLAAAIRTVGWLRRVLPDLATTRICDGHGTDIDVGQRQSGRTRNLGTFTNQDEQDEGSFGALFLVARLSVFLAMSEDALAPLRDLADQETEKRLVGNTGTGTGTTSLNVAGGRSEPSRRPSAHAPVHSIHGQQTERYLKRYIEIFREQSFATVQMYGNIFPHSTSTATSREDDTLRLPTALASFPFHLVSLLMETLQTYLPNITDDAARESLLIQVLYAANSLGRLGADFSMMISMLDLPGDRKVDPSEQTNGDGDADGTASTVEPEWYRAIKKHKIQAARLDALASGQESAVRRASQDVAVR